ncbi:MULTISPECIES: prohibitin family protein [unclassified Helicobacter]|uniref:prohibitin family protein n=1 Tax=unclassified Helicobacter TaxID=2593540 RepID=UPI000CF13885|nr:MULTISPECIES: prohibitin family protein [unclassified Helicobacter]
MPIDFDWLGDKKSNNFSFKLLVAVAVVVITFVFFKPFVVINSGEVGIKVTAGEYDKIPLQPGIRFFIPIIQRIIVVDTKVRAINFSGTENMGILGKNQGIFRNDAISVMDSRGLTVSIELTVQYRLNPQTASLTLATYGPSWEQIIINPIVRDVVRNVIGRYPAEDLPTKRNEIASLISEGIRDDIAKRENQPVELSSVQLREIVLPVKIKEQIEKVQIARQEAERVRYEVERSKQEAEKVAALAKGEAEASRIKAQGSADAILIEAKARANANNAIANSLTDRLLKLREIEIQGKFNEALKENKDAQIFLMPGGAVPNLWVDTKKKASSMDK